MSQKILGANYKVIKGVLTGMEGKLISYNIDTDAGVLRVHGNGELNIPGSDIEFCGIKVRVPKKRRFVVAFCEWAVLDCLAFSIPKECTDEEFKTALEEIDTGDFIEDEQGRQWGWKDVKGEMIIGIVDAQSERDAIDMFDYPPQVLKVYELLV